MSQQDLRKSCNLKRVEFLAQTFGNFSLTKICDTIPGTFGIILVLQFDVLLKTEIKMFLDGYTSLLTSFVD